MLQELQIFAFVFIIIIIIIINKSKYDSWRS
jgi:hypothetical protein